MIDNNIEQTTKLKYSKMAITSMILGISSFGLLGIFSAIPGLILGIVSLVKIKNRNYMLKGKGFALAGIFTSALKTALFIYIVYSEINGPYLHRIKPIIPLEAGRLATLPASATSVKAEGWSFIFSGIDFLMFKASPQDIEKFIAESNSINTAPEIFDVNHQYLQMPEEPNVSLLQTEGYYQKYYYQNKSFLRNGGWPEWFDPTIKKKGRIYEIPAVNMHNWGEVIINDETNIVYIWVCWS